MPMSNLPPGVTDNDIEDAAGGDYDELVDYIIECGLTPAEVKEAIKQYFSRKSADVATSLWMTRRGPLPINVLEAFKHVIKQVREVHEFLHPGSTTSKDKKED